MKTLTTFLGLVTILEAKIVLASGLGQYKIVILIEHEGEKSIIKLHTTDYFLFDEANGSVNHSEIVMKAAETEIENAVHGYINSL